MNEHELFERAMASTGQEYFPRSKHHGGYARSTDQLMWLGWQLARQSAWQPIETAPKDGTVVLLKLPTGCISGSYDGAYWLESVLHAEMPVPSKPTHWMPLPELPK